MAPRKKPQQETPPGNTTLPATISLRPAEPFWPEMLEIANTMGISLGELGKLACEATVRMVKNQEVQVPEYVDRARALYAAGFGPKRKERIFPARPATADDLRDKPEISLRVFDQVPCGLPQPAWADRAIGEVTVAAHKYPDDAFGLLANGDSLDRAKLPSGKVGVQDGDVIICQCIDFRPAQIGDLVVASFNGEFCCKRLTKQGLVPESTNRKHKAIKIPVDGVRIVAVVLDAAKLPVRKYAL